VASPKNWNKLKAGNGFTHVWKNSETGDRVDIRELSNGNYRILYPDGKDEYYDDKDRARKGAVEWMRKHPQGKSRNVGGMSKFQRSRTNSGR